MIDPKQVHDTLRKHQLVDGYGLVMDLEQSHGPWLRDAASGEEYLDLFTCFASWPIGFGHPALKDETFRAELMQAALTKPANSDLYTASMAAFVDAFATRVTPAGFEHHFWVSGGALAVENSLKTAFDWKARKLGVENANDGNDLVIMHFRQAFHGRSGYTMSLTNTDPTKVSLFPKFDWPRIHNPAIVFDLEGNIENDIEAEERKSCDEIEAAFKKYAGRVAGILIEPLQGEGGDNHFRTEFLTKLRQYADEKECLLIFDEVQTGFFGSGKPWLWQHHDVRPDVVCFGKKSQICGIYAGPRIDEVEDNVFRKSSRINSTWGGNLVDMVRSRKFIEIIKDDNLEDNVTARGDQLVSGLRELAKERGQFSNVRGCGSLVAVSFEDAGARDATIKALFERKVMVLPCGTRSLRFRMPLILSAAEVDIALERLAECLDAKIQA